jgi:hypothetical protein
MDIDKFYDSGYHSKRHGNLIRTTSISGLAGRRRSACTSGISILSKARILDFGGGIGQSTAGIPKAVVFDASLETREMCRKRGF